MSLMNTVTKLAIGFAVAKGVSAMKSGGGIGNVMESLTAGAGGKGGGLGDLLGKLGAGAGGAQAGGGLGGMLGQLAGGGGQSGGGLGDLLGKLAGGGGASAASAGGLAGLGGLLGGLAGARGGSGGLESLLAQDNPPQEPDEDLVAKLMLRAMTQAARADGEIDANEKAKLMDVIRNSNPEDVAVVQGILQEPVDPARLAADTPKGLETQVYTMALNAIDPDNQSEAQYLHALGEALGISHATSNQIHDSLGAPRLYS